MNQFSARHSTSLQPLLLPSTTGQFLGGSASGAAPMGQYTTTTTTAFTTTTFPPASHSFGQDTDAQKHSKTPSFDEDDDDEFAHLNDDFELTEEAVRELQEQEMDYLNQKQFWNRDANPRENATASRCIATASRVPFTASSSVPFTGLGSCKAPARGVPTALASEGNIGLTALGSVLFTALGSVPFTAPTYNGVTSPTYNGATAPIYNGLTTHSNIGLITPTVFENSSNNVSKNAVEQRLRDVESQLQIMKSDNDRIKLENSNLLSNSLQKDGEIFVIRSNLQRVESENFGLKDAVSKNDRQTAQTHEQLKRRFEREIESLSTELQFQSAEFHKIKQTSFLTTSPPRTSPKKDLKRKAVSNPGGFPSISSFNEVPKLPVRSVGVMTEMEPEPELESITGTQIRNTVQDNNAPAAMDIDLAPDEDAKLTPPASADAALIVFPATSLTLGINPITRQSKFNFVFKEVFPSPFTSIRDEFNPSEFPKDLRELVEALIKEMSALMTGDFCRVYQMRATLVDGLESSISKQNPLLALLSLKALHFAIASDDELQSGLFLQAQADDTAFSDLCRISNAIRNLFTTSLQSITKHSTLLESIIAILLLIVRDNPSDSIPKIGPFFTAENILILFDSKNHPSSIISTVSLLHYIISDYDVFQNLMSLHGKDQKRATLYKLVAFLVEGAGSPRQAQMLKIAIIRLLSMTLVHHTAALKTLVSSNQVIHRLVQCIYRELQAYESNQRNLARPQLIKESVRLFYYILLHAPTIPAIENSYGTHNLFTIAMTTLLFEDLPALKDCRPLARDMLSMIMGPKMQAIERLFDEEGKKESDDDHG